MGKLIDRTGEVYGLLKVVSRDADALHPCGSKTVKWLCKCACGNEISVDVNNLRTGHTKSCGCISVKIPNGMKHGYLRNGTKHRLYVIWTNMKRRCKSETNPDYKNYGGRGISVCDEWENNFSSFAEWALNNGYSDQLTIDRIDNDGDYSPQNCRWTTMLIQRHNQRRLNDLAQLYRGYQHGKTLHSEV